MRGRCCAEVRPDHAGEQYDSFTIIVARKTSVSDVAGSPWLAGCEGLTSHTTNSSMRLTAKRTDVVSSGQLVIQYNTKCCETAQARRS